MISDNSRAAFNFFVQKGFAPHQAAGIVGNLIGESGTGLNTQARNAGDGRDGSDSIGIAQWNGARAQGLKNYAASKGVDWHDLNTQLEYLHSELQGPERAAGQALMAAKTPQEAGQAFLAFERPKDWSKPGAHPERAQYAANVYGLLAGQPIPSSALPVPGATMQAAQTPAPAASQIPANAIPAQPAVNLPAFAPQQAPASNSLLASLPAEQPPLLRSILPPRPRVDTSKLRASFQPRQLGGVFLRG